MSDHRMIEEGEKEAAVGAFLLAHEGHAREVEVQIGGWTVYCRGSGALFALQINSNFFWMFQTLLGVSTQGALKALTLVTAMASVVSLLLILALYLVV